MSSPPPLRFATDDTALRLALDTAAEHWLTSRHDHRFADAGMHMKMWLLIAIAIAGYAAALVQETALGFFVGYLVFMNAGMLLAINVLHDASHNTFLRTPRANRLLGRIISIPLGMDPECWRVRHVLFHHPHVNVPGHDLDIEENGVLRQTPFQRWKPFMRWQRFDWQDRAGITPVGAQMAHHGRRGWGVFLLGKAAHAALALGLPCYLVGDRIGMGSVLITYFVCQATASLLFVLLILGTHWAKGRFFLVPDDGWLPHGRWEHQFATTFDWHTTPTCLTYWLGGMNMHLTHHLFPGWSHRHYPALGQIVAQVATDRRLDHGTTGLLGFVSGQQRFLARMGREDVGEIGPAPTAR
jgi:linoleoyl-CoA desaturase